MWSILGNIQRNLIWAIPAMMLGGFALGSMGNPIHLKTLILPLTFLMVYPMMVNLQISSLLRRDGIICQIATLLINFAIIPFIAFAIGKWFFPDQPLLALGLLLAALLPTSGMTISWTGFAGGDLKAAVQMTVIGLLAGSLLTPLYANWLLGQSVPIPLAKVFTQIALIVFLPMALGVITRLVLVKSVGKESYQSKWKKRIPTLSTVGVLGIVFVAIALKAKDITAEPQLLLDILIPLLILYGINFMLSTIIGKFLFPRAQGIALVYGTVMRNLSIALAIAMSVFGEQGAQIAIVIALAYIIQVQSAAWYVKFTPAIFGPAPDTEKETAATQVPRRNSEIIRIRPQENTMAKEPEPKPVKICCQNERK